MTKSLYQQYTVCLPNPPEKVDLSRCKAIAVDALNGERGRTRKRFAEIFNHPFDAIEDRGDGWRTLHFPLNTDQIFQKWEDGDRLIGLRFGKETTYGMIDIDSGSKYHNEEGLKACRDALAMLGIEDSLLHQSSHSTGWHLFFFLPVAVPTFALSCGLQDALEMAGLELKPGQLEVFPNRKGRTKDGFTLYNGHRLPLQPGSGSALLGEDFLPYSDSIEVFLDQAAAAAQCVDIDLLLSACQTAKNLFTASLFRSPNQPLPKRFGGRRLLKELDLVIGEGWTDNHQSNDILGAIAAKGRIFEGLAGEELANYIYSTAIGLPGYQEFCRHQKELRGWATRWARCAERKYYPYGSRKGGFGFKLLQAAGPSNEERKADAMTRIANAVTDFEESGREWPNTIRERRKLIAKLAHCSERTLAKPDYLPLWHPNHRNLDTARDGEATQHRDHTPHMTMWLPDLPLSSLSHHPVPPPAAGSCTKPTLTLIQQGTQPFTIQESVPMPENKVNNTNKPTTTPKLGDWLVEPDRRHILLRLQSVDGEGWCRCQDERERRLGLRGSLYWLPDLLPAPIAEVGEVDCA